MPKSKIFLVEAESRYLLNSTFLRFSEFSENINFCGRIFTLEEFMDWYAEKFGNFTYFEDWTGFNIPSRVLKPFREGRFNPLSEKEKRFLKLWKEIPEPFYIIGVSPGSVDLPTLKHEIIHGLFNTDPSYHQIVKICLLDKNLNNVSDALKKASYHPSVWLDEINAYAISGASKLISYGLDLKKFRPVRRMVRGIFKEHFGWDIATASKEKMLKLVERVPYGS